MAARIVNFPLARITADLREALDAVDLFEEALLQAIGDKPPTGLQVAAFATVAGLRRKHSRGPMAPPSPGAA